MHDRSFPHSPRNIFARFLAWPLLATFACSGFARAETEIPRIQAEPSVATTIRSFDFRNGQYESPLAERTVRVQNGVGQTGVSTLSISVQYGDLNGDGEEDAAVLWQDDGTAGSSTGVRTYQFSDGALRPWIELEGGSRVDGYWNQILIEQGELITVADPAQGPNADPCAGQVLSFLYASGEEFEQRLSYCDDGTDPNSPLLRAKMPEDLRDFIEQRQACDHFRGEPVEGDDPESTARRAFVASKIEETCRGSDAALARFKARHGADPEFLRVLNQFEDQIE